MVEPPSGTVTFLFTDIEGSTRRWEAEASTMREELARHDVILRAAIEAHDGHVLKSMGDGVLAVFGRIGDAVRAAVDAQLALRADQLPAVRMGIHTGEAEERDGDYFGPTLNRAARLMSVAWGGQIVVSLVAARLLADSLPDGVALLDLGEHRLRDLSQAERVFQVVAPGLPSEFEPLRSLERYRTNLPLRTTSFVGRERALAEIASVLTTVRMVTITGVGGVGKTRLALQVAADLVPEYADGVWMFELAPAANRDEVLQIVAGVLDVSIRPGRSLEASLLETIRGKELLLVFDNCEHLLEPTAELAERILGACPDVRIVATSREGLGVEGEQIWPLRSLALPDPDGDGGGAGRRSRGATLRRAGPRRAADLRPRRRLGVSGGRDLSPTGRDAAGHRTGRGPGGGHDADGDRGTSRRAVPPADRWSAGRDGTAPDPASHGRLVLLPAHAGGAAGVRLAGGVRRHLRHRCGRRRSSPSTASSRGT